jgi:hypothetical protein
MSRAVEFVVTPGHESARMTRECEAGPGLVACVRLAGSSSLEG